MTNNEEHVLVILKWRAESISKREEWINYNGPSSAQNKPKQEIHSIFKSTTRVDFIYEAVTLFTKY